jgi:transposase
MQWKYFIGIDVSKLTLDVCINQGKEKIFSVSLSNSVKALDRLWKDLCKQFPEFNPAETVCCLEHTGIYNTHLLSFLAGKKVSICLENPTHIKLSGGLTRGKNDKVDAERIANYVYKERETIRLWEPARDIIKTLKHLSVLRLRLVNVKKSLTVPQCEIKAFDKQASKMMTDLCKNTIKSVQKDLKVVDEKILAVIRQDETLNRLFNLTQSVIGIGAVTAVEILITTNEFKNIKTAPQFACYSGIAPFDHQSGTSVKTKPRVSHRANKRVKTLLHLAAITSTMNPGEMRDYMLRKVDEGKSKMAVLNAVRNKIVHRVFSCVNNNRMYEKKYENILA